MPSTPKDIFKHIGLQIKGQVKWNTSIPLDKCGLYVIALTDVQDKMICHTIPQFNDLAIGNWLSTVKSRNKQILIDNLIANSQDIKNRLSKFWLPDETVVYIGKAGPLPSRTLRKRVDEYYSTKLGCDKKHAGGHWLNILNNINQLTVFYCDYVHNDIGEKEEEMLSYFIESVSINTKKSLYDMINCFPFANKEIHRHSLKSKIKKNHGLNNQTIYCGQKWRKNGP
ncbi:hypothetical protein ABIB40_001503 [Pedobacter sp. UYP30]|uniref:hypothetical protein n=1 Tax=Pedobacter sp. UYP30 TaxID=1756400 RepID=UPI00339726C3